MTFDPLTLDPDVRAALDSTAIAHLATVMPDGGPHVSPIWIATRGDQLVFLTGRGTRKARNIRRDPRVAISLTPPDSPYTPVAIRGRVVEWIDGDAGWAIVDDIARKYTGQPFSRASERIAAVIDVDHQTAGL